MSQRVQPLLEEFYRILDEEIESNAGRIEQCLKEIIQRKLWMTAGCLEIHADVDTSKGEWSLSVSRIFHLLIDGTLMDTLRSCVFSEEFRRSLTDLSDLPDIDAEDREKLFLLLHEFGFRANFCLSVYLHHLISQLFGAAELRKEFVLMLTPEVTTVENELPDEETVTDELAAILSLLICTTLTGNIFGVRDDLDQAGELTANRNLVLFPPICHYCLKC